MAIPAGNYSYSGDTDAASSAATGGRIGGLVINNNAAGSGIGIVKMLALAGLGLVIYRLFK